MTPLETILTEMFARVGDKYEEEKTSSDSWYNSHEWTIEEQNSFKDWLTDYLYNNKDARKFMMSFPIKDKKRCKETASQFNAWYGWKTKKSITEK